MTDSVRYEQRDSVAIISLNRPDALNGFTTELRSDLHAALASAGDDASVRVVVLTGEGRCFSAGADLKAGFDGTRGVESQLQDEYRPSLEAIAALPKPVIAAVNGFAAGIGLSFALQCDLVMMAEDAFLLSPFTTISLVPDGGANWMLVRQLGYHRAYELSIESSRIAASRCVELGLANRTAPAESLVADAVAWGAELAKRAPLSLAATKQAMRFAMDNDWGASFDLEASLQKDLLASDDAREGVAAFFEKRAPEFKGS
jgi:2-(1,2-epoxy-1,2-dihydrophenyl)acetyl-CoA isomerase